MKWSRVSTIFLSAVIAVAVVGYFVGLADGVPKPLGLHSGIRQEFSLPEATNSWLTSPDRRVIPAVRYAEIPHTRMGPTAEFRASDKSLPAIEYDLFAEIHPSESAKLSSSKIRASRRAFNGAPPVIPHTVHNTTDAACYACHSSGMQLAGLKASVMSHAFLANCTQCHASPPPSPFKQIDSHVESTFVGLPAPTAGMRAGPGAPPSIPHSQWMRENCNACHGGPNGWAGMESTHPWRTNCTQCHAPSAKLDQAIAVVEVPMLPPLEVTNR